MMQSQILRFTTAFDEYGSLFLQAKVEGELRRIEEGLIVCIRTHLSGRQDPEAQEIKLSAPIHLAFRAFQAIDLTFHLPAPPRLRASGPERGIIAAHAFCQAPDFRTLTLAGLPEPVVKGLDVALLHQEATSLLLWHSWSICRCCRLVSLSAGSTKSKAGFVEREPLLSGRRRHRWRHFHPSRRRQLCAPLSGDPFQLSL
jgi:hypothetical protein